MGMVWGFFLSFLKIADNVCRLENTIYFSIDEALSVIL